MTLHSERSMSSGARALFVAILVFSAALGCGVKPANDALDSAIEATLVGQLLLPKGAGSRGVEILVSLTAADSQPPIVWVLFDEQGRFAHSFRRSITSVEVTAGGGTEVSRFDSAELPAINQASQVNLGVIDLRDQLFSHRQSLRAAEGAKSGEVRVAIWSGPPPRGPSGEPVSLGSRQFPTVMFGDELEWLIPKGAAEIYFLAERPAESGSGSGWSSGRQQLFGPYTSVNLPNELVVD